MTNNEEVSFSSFLYASHRTKSYFCSLLNIKAESKYGKSAGLDSENCKRDYIFIFFPFFSCCTGISLLFCIQPISTLSAPYHGWCQAKLVLWWRTFSWAFPTYKIYVGKNVAGHFSLLVYLGTKGKVEFSSLEVNKTWKMLPSRVRKKSTHNLNF